MTAAAAPADDAVAPVDRRPLVAVTATVRRRGGPRAQPVVSVNASYLRALDAVGLTPVVISPAHSRAAVRALLQVCGGLVLTGGEDVAPQRYGALPHPALGAVTRARDALEWSALEAALARRLPVFGICRGIQVLNAFFGGSLYQDLPSELPGCLDHAPAAGLGTRVHPVAIAEHSRLHWAVGRREVDVNSSHHQAIRRLAPGLTATARAPDGLVEAVEADPDRWVLGVQWHPERHPPGAPPDHPDRLLFHAFKRAVDGGPDTRAPEPAGHA